MQNLDVISVNIWNILISLVNLVLLFIIIKKFLYKPVKKVLAERQSQLEQSYSEAAKAEADALQSQKEWEKALLKAKTDADEIILNATENAKTHKDAIISEATQKADSIINRAKKEAELEKQKATEDIKREIVEVSKALSEKMLEREINTADHKDLIDSFIENIGE